MEPIHDSAVLSRCDSASDLQQFCRKVLFICHWCIPGSEQLPTLVHSRASPPTLVSYAKINYAALLTCSQKLRNTPEGRCLIRYLLEYAALPLRGQVGVKVFFFSKNPSCRGARWYHKVYQMIAITSYVAIRAPTHEHARFNSKADKRSSHRFSSG